MPGTPKIPCNDICSAMKRAHAVHHRSLPSDACQGQCMLQQKKLLPCMLQFQSTTHLSFDSVICAVQIVCISIRMRLGRRRQPGLLCDSQSVCCPSLVRSMSCAKCRHHCCRSGQQRCNRYHDSAEFQESCAATQPAADLTQRTMRQSIALNPCLQCACRSQGSTRVCRQVEQNAHLPSSNTPGGIV